MYLKCICVINSYRYVIVKMPKMLYYIYIMSITSPSWMGLLMVAANVITRWTYAKL